MYALSSYLWCTCCTCYCACHGVGWDGVGAVGHGRRVIYMASNGRAGAPSQDVDCTNRRGRVKGAGASPATCGSKALRLASLALGGTTQRMLCTFNRRQAAAGTWASCSSRRALRPCNPLPCLYSSEGCGGQTPLPRRSSSARYDRGWAAWRREVEQRDQEAAVG